MVNPVGGNYASGDKFQDGYKNGFIVSVLSNTTLSLTPGSCLDSTNESNITTSLSLSVNAAVSGANGLDTGTFTASKLYNVFVIWNSMDSTADPAALISLGATAPVLLPVGYDSFRRVGVALTDGSTHFRILYAYGNGSVVQYTFDTPVSVLSAGNATSATPVSLDQLCPATNKIPVMLECAFTPGAAGRTLTLYPSGSAGTSQNIVMGQVTSVVITTQVMVNALLISSIPKFDYKVSNSGDAATIYIAGFSDQV